MDQDLEHLKLLSIFHYVLAAFTGLFACFPLLHLTMGISMLSGGFSSGAPSSAPPTIFGLMFVIIPALFILTGWALAICLFLAGRYLASKTHRLFCLVMAGISCALAPFGTVLGVFTIVVLMRPTVKALFSS